MGRFEVTRAQYAAFDPLYDIPPGTENHPANGITFDKAKAYLAWLSNLTGSSWRLPTEDEFASLGSKGEEENTLDSWAGYSLNPDDARRLEAEFEKLGGADALLREVGSFQGRGDEGEELLYDLGGNVAEWVLGRDGAAKTLGGSADRPADPAAAPRPASPGCTGFRVVKENR
ncbi:MAG: formylglycine-generating enzyme family protein [Candidatus Aminicenantes bacterium]|nr:formylglycine-generating enzyme family protein [Candidatus Aminicenantes bacterium]